jgi:hypothetical protein
MPGWCISMQLQQQCACVILFDGWLGVTTAVTLSRAIEGLQCACGTA